MDKYWPICQRRRLEDLAKVVMFWTTILDHQCSNMPLGGSLPAPYVKGCCRQDPQTTHLIHPCRGWSIALSGSVRRYALESQSCLCLRTIPQAQYTIELLYHKASSLEQKNGCFMRIRNHPKSLSRAYSGTVAIV